MEEGEDGKGEEGAVGGLGHEPEECHQKVGDVVISEKLLGVDGLALVGLVDDDTKGGNHGHEDLPVPESRELSDSQEGEGGKHVKSDTKEHQEVA